MLGQVRVEGDAQRWKLPGKLREISGLALTPDGRLLAHEDQHAIVYEIDPREGKLVKAFALGNPTEEDDFEGIAVAEERVYLVTSKGRLYETREGADGERMRFNTYDPGVDEACFEIEGLAFEPTARVLLLACKRARRLEDEDHILIFRWSLAQRELADPAQLRIPSQALVPDGERADQFRPSGIARHAATHHLLLLSSKNHSLAEITAKGEVVALQQLPAQHHRQAEGIALDADALLIADEGGKKRSRLARYPKRTPVR